MNVIKILIVDDHLVIRNGFMTFLKTIDDMLVVGEASNGQEAIEKSLELKPDVVLMDMMMPKLGGIEAIRAIRERDSGIKFIAITSFSENHELVKAALEAGALGYIFKNVSIKELEQAIRMVYAGQPSLDPQALSLLLESKPSKVGDDFKLTEREREILRLVAQGLSNNMIAQHLAISISTVKFHVSTILSKLHASSRTEALAIANKYKLLD